MTYDEIKTIFDSFIEFPEESDKLTVTTTSCTLFARHIAKIAAEREREACQRAFWEACRPHGKAGEVIYTTYKHIRTRNNE